MEYTYIQKMSILRILLDLISVDGKIDARETYFFEEVKDKMKLNSEDHFKVREYNTLNCLGILKEMTPEQKELFRKFMTGIILADNVIEENEKIAYNNVCIFCGIDKKTL